MDEPKRSRWPWVALGVGTLFLVASIVAVVGLRSYTPLAFEGGAWLADGPSRQVDGDPFDEEEAIDFEYRAGGTAGFAFDVTNSGPLAVKIEGLVPDDPGFHYFARYTGLELVPGGESAKTVEGAVPFHPVTIEAGERLWLVVRFRMEACDEDWVTSGTSQWREGVELRYSYLGVFERSQPVGFPVRLQVTCP
jgi:hypothetical protein